MGKDHGGKIDNINIIVLLLVFLFNIINQISENKDIIERATYTLPFLLILIAIVIFKNNKYLQAFIFMIVGVFVTLDAPNISDFSSAILFIYSVHLIKKHYYSVFILLLTVSIITIRSLLFKDTIPGSFIMVSVYLYIYTIYFMLIYSKAEVTTVVKFEGLTKEENQILRYMANGLSQKEAGFELGYDKFQTNYIVKEIRKKTGYNSLYEILYRIGVKDHSISGHNK